MTQYKCEKRELNNRKVVKNNNVAKGNKTNIKERETRDVDFYIREYERGSVTKVINCANIIIK